MGHFGIWNLVLYPLFSLLLLFDLLSCLFLSFLLFSLFSPSLLFSLLFSPRLSPFLSLLSYYNRSDPRWVLCYKSFKTTKNKGNPTSRKENRYKSIFQ